MELNLTNFRALHAECMINKMVNKLKETINNKGNSKSKNSKSNIEEIGSEKYEEAIEQFERINRKCILLNSNYKFESSLSPAEITKELK